jgi:hypothetical protein
MVTSTIVSKATQPNLTCTITGATWGLQGRTFDGIDDVIALSAATALNNLTPLTFIAWIKPTSIGENNRGRILFKKATSTTTGLMWYLFSTTGFSFFVDYDGNDLYRQSPNNALTLGSWAMIATTWTGEVAATSVIHYLNGNPVASYAAGQDATGSRVSDASNLLRIGNDESGDSTFNGMLGDVLIYSRVLTNPEINGIRLVTQWRY